MRRSDQTDSELVLAVRSGEQEAFGELFERWFSSSWNVARTIVRSDELAADVAQDALLAAWQGLDQLNDPEAFGGWLLRIARNRALNRLEREQRSTATGDEVVSGLRDRGLPDPTGAERTPGPDSISEVRDRQELVWAAAAALGERDVSLLDLHLRHGLGPAEIAEELGVEANNAHQQLFRLRNKLGDAIGSYLLWRNGRPLCQGLAEAVSGDVAFDRSVAHAVSRHQADCEYCSERRASLVDPGKLFAAVPLVLVPSHLQLQAAAALQSAGVPTGGSSGSSGSQDPTNGADGTGQGDGTAGQDLGSQQPGGQSSPLQESWSQGPGQGLEGSGGRQPGVYDQTSLHTVTGEPSAGLGGGGPGWPGTGTGGGGSMGTGVAAFGSGLFDSLSARKLASGIGAAALAAVVIIAFFLGLTGDDDGDIAAIGSESSIGDPSGTLGEASEGQSGAEQGNASQQFGPAGPTSQGDDSADGEPASSGPGLAGDETTTSTGSSTAGPTATGTIRTTTTGDTVSTTGTTATTGPIETTSTSGPTTTETIGDTTTTVDITTTTVETTTTTAETTTTTTAPPQPEIVRFTSRRLPGPLLCSDPNQGPFEAIWDTENADKVRLITPSGSHNGGPSGTHRFCGTTGDTIRLTATGPGGKDSARTTL